nr:biosynthetic peptidoglycan transglycosylase [uncultured Halomonas sp.]
MLTKKPKTMLDYFDGKPVAAFDIKGFLIYYNLVLDSLLDDIESRKHDSSLSRTEDTSKLETHVIALEDRRFYKHKGFDIKCIPRILKQIMTCQKIGGMSTIEQQYVRTYINRRERTLGRKTHEIIISWLLSHRSEKRSILITYLSVAYFGYKLNGCDCAANFVFGKNAAELKLEESAFLASLLVYPLPKVVKNLAIRLDFFPITKDLDQFLIAAESVAPWWAKRVEARLNYSLFLTDKPKKSKN